MAENNTEGKRQLLQQKYMEMQMISQQIQQIQKQLELIENQMQELIVTKEALHTIGFGDYTNYDCIKTEEMRWFKSHILKSFFLLDIEKYDDLRIYEKGHNNNSQKKRERAKWIDEQIEKTDFERLHIEIDSEEFLAKMTIIVPKGTEYFGKVGFIEISLKTKEGTILDNVNYDMEFRDKKLDSLYCSSYCYKSKVPDEDTAIDLDTKALSGMYEKMQTTPEELRKELEKMLGKETVERIDDLFQKPENARYTLPKRERQLAKLKEMYSIVETYRDCQTFNNFKDEYLAQTEVN